MNFVIKRNLWICGQPGINQIKENCLGKGASRLLNTDNFMCCLGHIALQLGASTLDIEGRCYPSHIKQLANTLLLKDVGGDWVNSEFTIAAATINDCQDTTVEEKEKELMLLAKEYGHTIQFV